MKNLLNKIMITLLIFCMLPCSLGVYAFEFPHEFWKPAQSYSDAYNSKDHNGIIKYGKQLLEIIKNSPNCAEKREVLASKNREVALSYSALGDAENAYYHYKQLYDIVLQYPDELGRYYELAKAGVEAYKSELELYVDGGQALYYGAKNEKSNGVLFGVNADSPIREKGLLENESMILTYQELGQPLLGYNIGVFNQAKESGCAIEYALNCPKEGTDIRNYKNYDTFLNDISKLFAEYPTVPVFLRFAAEFNVWENPTKPDEFIKAFRYVSDFFKNRNTNVAVVWSPNHISKIGVNVHDFYPGDKYVDWVGLSSYALKYYLGDKNQSLANNIINKTGDSSQPIVAIREYVEKYGDRKPMMLSESGCCHHVYTGNGEDTTTFALQRLREYYTYIPMVYPQIKLIAHFDQFAPGAYNDFRLSNNKLLSDEYLKFVKNERFIQDGFYNNSDICYRKVVDGTNVDSIFSVSCYAYLHGEEFNKVIYYIDGEYAGMSSEMPFSAHIDATKYKGKHTLKAVAVGKSGKRFERERKIVINNSGREIKVELSKKEITFDRKPILYNGRTMVPMRKIFEALDAEVYWNADTRTATGVRGDRRIEITVGNKKMYLNGKEIILDTAPIILDERTLVPVRAVAEGLGCDVKWNNERSTVEIIPKEK